jgi:penicillin-binding protein 2
MKLMFPEKRLAQLSALVVLFLLAFSVNLTAQSRKKADSKKKQTASKDARKDSRKDSKREQLAKKDSKRDSRRDKASAKAKDSRKDSKKEKLTAKERAKDKAKDRDSKKVDKQSRAERRREEAERRRAEEARRQAILAEQRRREQAAREARARRLAFERGLRDETQANILKDNPEGEDLNVRRAAVNALGNHAGTVVVMEAKTGKVLTIVNQDWAIRNSFKPCSTIKLVTAVGGLTENVINDDGSVRNTATRRNLNDAIAFSDNSYFQRVGVNMGTNRMIDYAKRLGLGEPTGINAAGETAGKLPYGNNNARIYSHGDDFEVTPLQLAVMTSAIANHGRKVVPQIQRDRFDRTAFRPQMKAQLSVPERSIETLLPGMIGAAEYGTAHRGVDASQGIAGKTGSCIFKGTWIGLFTSVAPVEDPKYSVVVITRGEGERGKYAAAIAGKVYGALRGDIHRDPNSMFAKRQVKPAFDRAAIDKDEDEDEDENAVTADDLINDQAPIVVGSQRTQVVAAQPAPEQKKLVQRTSSSKPVNFPPTVITFDRSGADTQDKTVIEKKERPRIIRNK